MNTAAILYIPADKRARTIWSAHGLDADHERRLAVRGRGWLVQLPEPEPVDDPQLAFAVLHDSAARPIGAVLAVKAAPSSWTEDEREIIRLAAEFYGPLIDARATAEAEVPGRPEADILDALGRGELELVYQPEYDLVSREVVALEALLRWRHPVHGEISPGEFIGHAERSGVITVVGAWVIDHAAQALASWNATAPGRNVLLRVNVSPVQLVGPQLVPLFEAAMDSHHVPGRQLCIELTETEPLHNPSEVADTLRRLKALGISSALDDLATGYSSLSQLRVLPVDAIKLDRSLIADIDRDTRAQAIVAALVGLALNFGMDVVAEGVETEAETRTLPRLGCTRAQGHYLGRPVSSERVPELLQKRR